MADDMKILEKLLNSTIVGVEALVSALNLWTVGSNVEKPVEHVIEIEKKGDRIREEFTKYLYSTSHSLFARSDKLRLAGKIDKIMDFAEIAARYMLIMPKCEFEKGLISEIKELGDIVYETVGALKDCILEINDDFDRAIKKAKKVEDLRRNARNLEWKILKGLMSSGKPTAEILLAKQVIELVTIVADKAEGISDFVDDLAIKYKTLR